LRHSASSSLSASSAADSDSTFHNSLFGAAEIQHSLQQIKLHITSLQDVLQDSEHNVQQQQQKTTPNNNNSSTDDGTLFNTSHQRAHYHAIVVFLFKKLQEASKKFQFVRNLQTEKAKERVK